mmetsp:Transcript_2389/g.3997  ORF Transcript_2389/g.3997 Transcript_2389/m.3997 type:complete len:255 (-) Transcript_2389:320-1084(-)|eukprot:CAMPEP_0198212396 /NCGR_PEP_ID=MMETSP1445-20131203/25879_1 /TAXON_ID=36898 /ORGANISM="Pyramimonas sp., Strain CCMP2087" /LENGTH=254 /DNA_ID=CAMNT_0043886829 /DNA_START=92 /DNA_END=856 /DNA_ORIENTATION=-
MLATKAVFLGQCVQPSARRTTSAVPLARARATAVVSCTSENALPVSSHKIQRRDVLSLAAAAAIATSAPPVFAEERDTITFYGAANPPASYGGIGGTAPDKARYTFQYPADEFKELAVSKVEKGANGTDTKFVSTARAKKQQIYVVTLANEGGSGGFKSMDADRLLEGVSGSDYVFQDALNLGEITSSKRQVDDDTFFDYTIEGADNFLMSITTRQGRLFAIFVNSPLKNFKEDRAALEKIRDSFRTIEVDVLY